MTNTPANISQQPATDISDYSSGHSTVPTFTCTIRADWVANKAGLALLPPPVLARFMDLCRLLRAKLGADFGWHNPIHKAPDFGVFVMIQRKGGERFYARRVGVPGDWHWEEKGSGVIVKRTYVRRWFAVPGEEQT